MVREGERKDIPIITSLLEEAHQVGEYKEYEVERIAIMQLVNGILDRKTVRGENGTCALVWDDDGVQGFILGIRERIYHVSKDFRATDIFFYIAREYNDPLAFIMLLKGFEEWALSHPRVKRIDLGITNIIGDPRRLAVIYRRYGYTECGIMLTKPRPEHF